MHFKRVRIVFAFALALAALLTGCSKKPNQSFAEAHDAFQTKLVREENDSDPIPDPPEGVFDLVSYPSKVGDLAAYVSSDPGDGQKHPMIIWVVGGWGNGIDELPWTNPEWDNDQTGSAFWQAGVLTMYPSFRGGSGNPGHYEALFGEVDDIVSAYEYAASLPYVDPNRIYLGGHSTGGTRALLASEYTDKFRAVFCFGAVDEVKYHNNSQFTFDTSNQEEYTMRSPIHWLQDVKSPTFLIEGSEGNAENLQNMEKASKNENISCYLVEGADHFAALGPVTHLLAQKILADTGAECGITLSMDEIHTAMTQEPPALTPVMVPYTVENVGVSFQCPYQWDAEDISEEGETDLLFSSRFEGDNAWDMGSMYFYAYTDGMTGDAAELAAYLADQGYEVQETTVSGLPAVDGEGWEQSSSGENFYNRFVIVLKDDLCIEFNFYLHESYGDAGNAMFQTMIDSIALA